METDINERLIFPPPLSSIAEHFGEGFKKSKRFLILTRIS